MSDLWDYWWLWVLIIIIISIIYQRRRMRMRARNRAYLIARQQVSNNNGYNSNNPNVIQPIMGQQQPPMNPNIVYVIPNNNGYSNASAPPMNLGNHDNSQQNNPYYIGGPNPGNGNNASQNINNNTYQQNNIYNEYATEGQSTN